MIHTSLFQNTKDNKNAHPPMNKTTLHHIAALAGMAAMAATAQAFVLVSYDMETMATSANPDINRLAEPSLVNANITAGDLASFHNDSSNSGDFGQQNTYEGSTWNTFSHRALDETPFWQFTVTPEPEFTMSFASLQFDAFARMSLAGGTAEVDYVIRWDVNNFEGVLATVRGPQANTTDREVIVTGLTADLSALPDRTEATTFRIEVINLGGTNGQWTQRGGGIDNLTLNAIPEPTSALLAGLGLLALLRRKR